MWKSKSQKPGFRAEGETPEREYVSVIADYSADGKVRPVSIRLSGGAAYTVDRVISETRMSATKKNGSETRYYVKIGGREHYLFAEDISQNRKPAWFRLICQGELFDNDGDPSTGLIE